MLGVLAAPPRCRGVPPARRALTGPRRPQRLGTPYYCVLPGPRGLRRRVGTADPAGGREAPLRIKKIAERRTIWGGGRLRRKRGAEDHGDGREQPQERGARRLDRLHLPGGAGAQQRRPGLGHGRHPTTSSRGARRCPSTRRHPWSRPVARSSRRRSSTARTCTTTCTRYMASTRARSRSAVLFGVPRCCGAFTPSTQLVSIRRGRGWFLS